MSKKSKRQSKRQAKQQEFVPEYNQPVSITPRNDRQKELQHHLRTKPLTFAMGEAGTGKTYIATCEACDAFLDGRVDKIIVTRPMVTAEEEMGFLPGTVEEKFAPFFAPVREIMEERLGGRGRVEYLVKARKIVTLPIAYLRGHTFKDAFVIFDECQNTSPAQMKLFLTRLGENVTVCLSGDPNQVDVDFQTSGLADAESRLYSLPEVGVVHFKVEDVVRSGLTRKIIERYK